MASSLDVVTVGTCSELGNMFALPVSEVQAEIKFWPECLFNAVIKAELSV